MYQEITAYIHTIIILEDAELPQTAGNGQGGDLLADLFGGSPVAPAAQGGGGEQNLMSAQQVRCSVFC